MADPSRLTGIDAAYEKERHALQNRHGGSAPPTAQTVTVKTDIIYKRLNNLASTLSQIRYRLAPRESKSLSAGCAEEVPSSNIHFMLDSTNSILDHVCELAGEIDNLV